LVIISCHFRYPKLIYQNYFLTTSLFKIYICIVSLTDIYTYRLHIYIYIYFWVFKVDINFSFHLLPTFTLNRKTFHLPSIQVFQNHKFISSISLLIITNGFSTNFPKISITLIHGWSNHCDHHCYHHRATTTNKCGWTFFTTFW
jgi:hypothetical protein